MLVTKRQYSVKNLFSLDSLREEEGLEQLLFCQRIILGGFCLCPNKTKIGLGLVIVIIVPYNE